MDEKSYTKSAITKFMNDNLFFGDAKLKKYYERDQAGDVAKFRARMRSTHSTKTFEKLVYVFVTDNIRDIILDTIGELTTATKSMGDLIVSGGEAFNMYMPFNERVVTSDIDAKFVPLIPNDSKYFGKLQATKLILWDKLGEIAKRMNTKIVNRLKSVKSKVYKFTGLSFKSTGPKITRRYTLIKKKKNGKTNKPSAKDVFIDVELFALDLNVRCFSPDKNKVEDFVVGGILDIPFMRPDEFGHDVAHTRQRGIIYRNALTGKMIKNTYILVASREFLIEDIYLMHKLKLRPEKKEKDRQRLVKLGKLFNKNIKSSDSIEAIFKKVSPKLAKIKTLKKRVGVVNMKKATRVNPIKYDTYTSQPPEDRLSKQIVHGLKAVSANNNINGYERSHGNQRFNLKNYKWKNAKSNAYVKNEFNYRPLQAKSIPKNLQMNKTLYGFNPRRDSWMSKSLIERASKIPYIGLKK